MRQSLQTRQQILGLELIVVLMLVPGCDASKARQNHGTQPPAVGASPVERSSVAQSVPDVAPPAQDPRTVYVSNLAFNDDSAKIFPSLQHPNGVAEDGERIWGHDAVFQQLDACPDQVALGVARELRRSLAGQLHWSESQYEYTVFVFPDAPSPDSATPEAIRDHVFARMGVHRLFVDQGLLHGKRVDATIVSEWVEDRLVQPPPPDEDPNDYMPAKPELGDIDKDLQSSLSDFVLLEVDFGSTRWITAIDSDMLGGYVGDSDTLVFVMSTGIYT